MIRIDSKAVGGAMAIAGLLAAGAAHADPPGGRGVTGSKLVIVDKYRTNKAAFVFVAKDSTPGAIHKGVSASPPALSGTVEAFAVSDPSNRLVYSLAETGDKLTGSWVANKPTLAKYVNKGASVADRGAKTVVVKPDKLLKVQGKNLGDGDDDSGNQSATDLDASTLVAGETIRVIVMIDNTGNLPPDTHVMCADFVVDTVKQVAGNTGFKVVSKTSTAPPDGSCLGGSPSGAFVSADD